MATAGPGAGPLTCCWWLRVYRQGRVSAARLPAAMRQACMQRGGGGAHLVARAAWELLARGLGRAGRAGRGLPGLCSPCTRSLQTPFLMHITFPCTVRPICNPFARSRQRTLA
jgi:hypothetical protein